MFGAEQAKNWAYRLNAHGSLSLPVNPDGDFLLRTAAQSSDREGPGKPRQTPPKPQRGFLPSGPLGTWQTLFHWASGQEDFRGIPQRLSRDPISKDFYFPDPAVIRQLTDAAGSGLRFYFHAKPRRIQGEPEDFNPLRLQAVTLGVLSECLPPDVTTTPELQNAAMKNQYLVDGLFRPEVYSENAAEGVVGSIYLPKLDAPDSRLKQGQFDLFLQSFKPVQLPNWS